MKIKLAVATIFYNNKLELQRLADSIPPNVVDYWICIDGPFRYNLDMNPDLPHDSDDGSLDVIMGDARTKFNYGVVLHHKAGATEFDKRNTYLENCKKLGIDVLLIIDSDEMFTYDDQEQGGKTPLQCWQRFIKNIELETIKNPHHNVYGIRYLEGGDNNNNTTTDTYKPRIWFKPYQMRYLYGSHYHYANMETEQRDIEYFKRYDQCYVQCAASIIKGVTLTHDHSLRSPKYLEQRKRYQQYLVKYEELTQRHKYTPEECDRMAKDDPATGFEPTTL